MSIYMWMGVGARSDIELAAAVAASSRDRSTPRVILFCIFSRVYRAFFLYFFFYIRGDAGDRRGYY